jgi:spermidine synthase
MVKSPPGATKRGADGRGLIQLKPTKFDVILTDTGLLLANQKLFSDQAYF